MQQDILIIEVLFPAIPLTMLYFASRYTLLVKLIRHLHDKVIRDNVSPTDIELFIIQIKRLRDRLYLIGITHSCAATTFVLAAMIAANFRHLEVASRLFQGSIPLLMRQFCCSQEKSRLPIPHRMFVCLILGLIRNGNNIQSQISTGPRKKIANTKGPHNDTYQNHHRHRPGHYQFARHPV